MRLPDDRLGVETTLEHVTTQSIATVEALREDTARVAEPGGKPWLGRVEDEMEMVRHHAERVADDAVTSNGFVERQEEIHDVVVAAKDALSAVSPRGDVAKPVDELAAWSSRHASTVTASNAAARVQGQIVRELTQGQSRDCPLTSRRYGSGTVPGLSPS